MTKREKIWLKAWTLSRNYGMDPKKCSEDANTCLDAFDKKFSKKVEPEEKDESLMNIEVRNGIYYKIDT